jgi:Rod binding domain-containing protein
LLDQHLALELSLGGCQLALADSVLNCVKRKQKGANATFGKDSKPISKDAARQDAAGAKLLCNVVAFYAKPGSVDKGVPLARSSDRCLSNNNQ